MVMDRLGSSLEDLVSKCGRKFSLKTVLMLAIQMLERIEFIHTRDILHRDIKPDNFLMGNGRNEHVLYIVDFGLAKKLTQKDGQHITYKENKNFTGTARYASLNTHLGIEQGRRDDLESMMYVVMYLYLGHLPWMGVSSKNKKEKYEKIMEMKMTMDINQFFTKFPKELADIFKYVRALDFEQLPDYQFIKDKLNVIMTSNGF